MAEFIELYQVRIIVTIISLLLLWALYERLIIWKFEQKITNGSDDIIKFLIVPVISSIDSPRNRRHRDLWYVRKIEFKDNVGDLKNYDFEFDPSILPQSLIDKYRDFKKSQWTIIDKYTTDFADSSEVERNRLDLVQKWIEQNLPDEIEVLQHKTNNMIEIKDPLMKYEWQINNNLEEVEYKQSPNWWRYMLLFIIVVFGWLVWYGRYLQHG